MQSVSDHSAKRRERIICHVSFSSVCVCVCVCVCLRGRTAGKNFSPLSSLIRLFLKTSPRLSDCHGYLLHLSHADVQTYTRRLKLAVFQVESGRGAKDSTICSCGWRSLKQLLLFHVPIVTIPF